MEKLFLNKEIFSEEVESTVRKHNISYMEAIVSICEEKEIEIELVKKHLSNRIKVKLESEAMELNYIPSGNTLPGL